MRGYLYNLISVRNLTFLAPVIISLAPSNRKLLKTVALLLQITQKNYINKIWLLLQSPYLKSGP
jgi:hypothetical protein